MPGLWQMEISRCAWVDLTPLYLEYHDAEWGVPSFSDVHLFEMLVLEGAQAGLSWTTILKKRESYRKAFAGFSPNEVANFSLEKQELLLMDPGIVRNRLKVHSAVENAKAFLSIQKEFGTFARFLWDFVDQKPIQNNWKSPQEVPAQTSGSRRLSKELKKRGFKFVGPTICYAFMQAVGMVNDHETSCFRHKMLLDAHRKEDNAGR